MKNKRIIYLTAGLLVLMLFLTNGCTLYYKIFYPLGRDKVPQREDPKETLELFRQSMEKGDYATAYHCLSKNAKRRYKYAHFRMLFDWTSFGVLLRSLLVNWDVKKIEIDRSDVNKAWVHLGHRHYPSYKKKLPFVYENKSWRADFTLAWSLSMPQEDEDILFPPPEEEEKKKDKDTKKKEDG